MTVVAVPTRSTPDGDPPYICCMWDGGVVGWQGLYSDEGASSSLDPVVLPLDPAGLGRWILVVALVVNYFHQ